MVQTVYLFYFYFFILHITQLLVSSCNNMFDLIIVLPKKVIKKSNY